MKNLPSLKKQQNKIDFKYTKDITNDIKTLTWLTNFHRIWAELSDENRQNLGNSVKVFWNIHKQIT